VKIKYVLYLHSQYTSSIVLSSLKIHNAKIAQLVERDLAKVEVAGSSPVFRSEIYQGFLLNQMLEWWNW
jgi:hypothetical protein